MAKLILKDGSVWEGTSFGANVSAAGEVVFATGMAGYPESLTDPSYRGQILVLTYPLIGNYGVPRKDTWESGKIQVEGLVVSNYNKTPSHHASLRTLSEWLKAENVPALEIPDTREIVLRLREKGSALGGIVLKGENSIKFDDPNARNLAAEVSTKKPKIYGKGKKTVVLLDCGVKKNIVRELAKRSIKTIVVPWNYDPFKAGVKFHGILISNGPGDPAKALATIETARYALAKKIPMFGICLGNQILALAAGGKTSKMKFGHRGQNQPVSLAGTKKCFLTTQNHGFEVKKIPPGFRPWFTNLNDGTNEGMIHEKLPFMSVQFHPEACPGPTDTEWLFDEFVKKL